jgi:hypothetical protein
VTLLNMTGLPLNVSVEIVLVTISCGGLASA